MSKFLILFFLFTGNALANSLPTNKQEFCRRFTDQSNSSINNMALDSDNLISFKNDGGLFDGGVCWWHSRLQRNIFYLAILAPNQARPNTNEAIKIIKSLRLSNEVVTIPGYDKLSDFTSDFKIQIQKELNAWQLYDGLVLGGWIDGLKGDTTTSPENLLLKMSVLNDYVSIQKKIAYQKLQIKGITSHAWLVTGTFITETGMDIGLIDSNSPNKTLLYRYKLGDISFNAMGYGNFIPYLEFIREEKKISSVAENYCNKKIAIEYKPSDYEDDLTDFELNN